MHDNKNGCLMCLLRIVSGTVFAPIQFICSHNEKSRVYTKVRKLVYGLQWLGLCVNIVLTMAITFNNEYSNAENTGGLKLVKETFFFLCGYFCWFWKLLSVPNNVVTYNGWSVIQENKNYFQIQLYSFKKEWKTLTWNRRLFHLILWCFTIFYACYIIYYIENENFYIKLSKVCVVYYIHSHFFELQMHCHFNRIFENFFEFSLRNTLLLSIPPDERSTYYGGKDWIYDYKFRYVRLEKKISMRCRLYLASVQTTNVFLKMIDFYSLIMMALLTLSAIVDTFLLINPDVTTEPGEVFEYWYLKLSYIFIEVLLLYRADQVNNMNEDVLSFLFKYPISKLTRQEAAQVEMLVATLILQKPVVRASDTITIGRRLLASISGTVLTYVLVALQFRAAWSET